MKHSAYVIEIEQAEKETRRPMLNTRHKIATQIVQISQITNNWNELEKHLNHEIEEWQDASDEWTKAQVQEDKIILERMKEIKEGNE